MISQDKSLANSSLGEEQVMHTLSQEILPSKGCQKIYGEDSAQRGSVENTIQRTSLEKVSQDKRS